MANCNCGREMLTAKGCKYSHLKCNGKFYERIKVGDPMDFPVGPSGKCHDCAASIGYFHHVNCDAERCPICGGQLLGCDCEISFAYDPDKPISKKGRELIYEYLEHQNSKSTNKYKLIRYSK